MPAGGETGHLGKDGKKLVRRLASSFAACRDDAAAYGQCIKLHLESVQKGACEKEFLALSECFRKAIGSAREIFARGQTQRDTTYDPQRYPWIVLSL